VLATSTAPTKSPVSSWVQGTSPRLSQLSTATAPTHGPHTHRRRPHDTHHRRSYLVLEILLPLLLFSLLASSLLGPLFRLIGRTLRLGLGIAIRAVDFIAAKVLDPILEKVLP
jgi:hypothetical protein